MPKFWVSLLFNGFKSSCIFFIFSLVCFITSSNSDVFGVSCNSDNVLLRLFNSPCFSVINFLCVENCSVKSLYSFLNFCNTFPFWVLLLLPSVVLLFFFALLRAKTLFTKASCSVNWVRGGLLIAANSLNFVSRVNLTQSVLFL